jgi:hypothetical protein|eukprot:COSAG01_NODE_2463_length_7647_cov_6.492183_5_plen_113_part_00
MIVPNPSFMLIMARLIMTHISHGSACLVGGGGGGGGGSSSSGGGGGGSSSVLRSVEEEVAVEQALLSLGLEPAAGLLLLRPELTADVAHDRRPMRLVAVSPIDTHPRRHLQG